jgi:hypothetical protein
MAHHQLLSPGTLSPKPAERRLSSLSLESVSSASSTWSLLEAVAPENQMPVRDSGWTKLLPVRSKKTSWTILESDLGDISEAISRTGSRLHGLKHERYWMTDGETSGSKEKKRARSGSGWVTVAEYSWGHLETSPLQTPVNLCKLSSNTNDSNKDKSLKKESEGPRALKEQLQDWVSDWTIIAEYNYESGETSPKDVSDQVLIPSTDSEEAKTVAPRDQRPKQSQQRDGKPTIKKPLLSYVNLPSRLKEVMQKKNVTGRDVEVAANLTRKGNREQQLPCQRPTAPIQQQPLQVEPPNQEALQQHPLGQHQPIQWQSQAYREREQQQQSRPCDPYQPLSESASGRQVF